MDIADKFAEALEADKVRHYRKKQTVAIRPAVPGEVVETVIDGQRETVNTAKAGDYVVRGTKGEHYIISAETLAERYGPPIGAPAGGRISRICREGELPMPSATRASHSNSWRPGAKT